MEENSQIIQLKTKKIILFLVFSVFSLVIMALIGRIITQITGHDVGRGFLLLINMDVEANLPTYFSSIILLLSSFLLAVISVVKLEVKDRFSKYWIVSSVGFFLMSVDEIAQIHELFTSPLRHLIHGSGVLYYAWIIPAIILVIILFFAFLKFLMHLPVQTRNLFITSACIYLGGAIGMEIVGGFLFEKYSYQSLIYSVGVIFEEVLEMTGIIVFIYSLIMYIKNQIDKITIFIK